MPSTPCSTRWCSPTLCAIWGCRRGRSGLLNSLTLLASGIGGVGFGFIADRIGRKRALMLSILTYSVCSFASGLSTSVLMLAAFRFMLGLGMGGEWNTGATLVAETWPTELRAKALSMVQSSFAIGYALAALVAGIMLRFANWRMVFFVGILPALRLHSGFRRACRNRACGRSIAVTGPEAANRVYSPMVSLRFSESLTRTRLSRCCCEFLRDVRMVGPVHLDSSVPIAAGEQGGRGFGVMGTTTLLLVLNLAGMFPGYASFGWVADRSGPSKVIHCVPGDGGGAGSAVCGGARSVDVDGCGNRGGVFWDGILFRIEHHRQ